MKRNYLLILFIIFGLIIKTTICFGFPDVNNCGCCKCNSDCKRNSCCNDDDKITSFHVRNNGFLAVDWTSPSGWTFNQNNEWYVWEKIAVW